ncbi:D-aminoacyl-tRNA deacylase [Pyrolobus fumarii]|uniref:D-aminoacyl-tRNA deacylase n=1 Tax=Pyrolobus fumarii TaxID=54252 RepID=UPI000AF4D381|nr:D-aminoacyl-tRNA deacylase [Pyrolobus fumarii]
MKIVYSLVDPVGKGVADILSREYSVDACPSRDCTVVGLEADTPYLDNLDDILPGYDGYVIISRHASTSGKPTLSVHHTGNPTREAILGGKPETLEWAWPSLAAALLRTYRAVAARLGLLEKYEVTLEATHHGPTRVPKPVVFIEVGSTEAAWRDERALRALAETLYETIISQEGFRGCECSTIASGFGDTHYPRLHTRLLLEEGYCYAHILSKHVLRSVTENVVRQSMTKSVERVEKAVAAKVPGAARRLVERIANELGIEVEKRG